ncbi:histidine kinase [Streptomyces sp. NPDC005708]|uniref:PAS domain-containing sensor histidine kinase n=1 Tax=Streptomyces sp. NPDC005708 TaxID=3154564 RepID=UPI0033C4D3E9
MIDMGILPSILGSVPQAVWVVAQDGRILYTNPAAVAALGYDDATELQGRLNHDILHPCHPDGSRFPASQCSMVSAMLTDEPTHGDEWFMRKDETFFPASWWAAPIDLPDGRGVVYSFFDATERSEVERARRERDAARIRADESCAAQRRLVQSIAAVRQQTARDLHDGAQQRLVSLVICLQLTREAMAEEASNVSTLLDQCVADARTAIDELRELVCGIHPSVLITKGLLAAVEALATRCPIPVTVHGSCDVRLPAAVESNAYFILAEALTNAVKHARASHVKISIKVGSVLELEVADDGIGGATTNSAGSGVVGMADRVAAFDGTLHIDSQPGSGTAVRAEIPIPA